MYNPHGGYGQYVQQQQLSVQAADRVTLIRMLLEGAISFNKKAQFALEKGEKKETLEAVDRAAKIVLHLYSCLNFDQGGEVAEHLGQLYNYVCDQYIIFQMDMNNFKSLESINDVLNTILEGWKQLPST